MDAVPALRVPGQTAMTTAYDAVVVGGGLAGSGVAIELARAGRSVVLFEKERTAHDKVCGEFISAEGLNYLHRLGVSVETLGGVPIGGVRLVRGGKPVAAALQFQAQSLSRRILDEALLDAAIEAGVEVRRGVRVKQLERDSGDFVATATSGKAIRAKAAFLATGKHDLRGHARGRGWQGDLLAFKWYWRLNMAETTDLAGHVELILFQGGYGGLQLVEDSKANLCVVVRRRDFLKLGGSFDALLRHMIDCNPHLERRLDGATLSMLRPLSISSIPYGYVAGPSDGIWRLGDQAAVIPSFSGDGMSIALHSASLAASRFLEGGSAFAFQRELRGQVHGQVLRASLVSKLLVARAGQSVALQTARLNAGIIQEVALMTRISHHALDLARALPSRRSPRNEAA